MKRRFLSLLLVLGLLVAMVPAVQAQGDDTYLTCFQLSEADCAIVLAAQANAASVSSANLGLNLNLLLNGLETIGMMLGADDAPMGDVTLTFNGGGPYTLVEGAEPPFALSFAFDAAFDDGTTSDTMSVGIVVADGVVYAQEDGGQWEGTTFEDLLASDPQTAALLQGLMGGETGELPEGVLNPDDLLGSSTADLLEAAGLGADAVDLVKTPGFITMTRLEDTDLNGTPVNVFETVVDTTPLFNSAEFQAFLNSSLSTAAESDPNAAQVAMLAPLLLTSTIVNMEVKQYIGANDMIDRGFDMHMLLTLDLSALMGGAGETEMELPPLMLDINASVYFDQINESIKIPAPEGAVMVEPGDM